MDQAARVGSNVVPICVRLYIVVIWTTYIPDGQIGLADLSVLIIHVVREGFCQQIQSLGLGDSWWQLCVLVHLHCHQSASSPEQLDQMWSREESSLVASHGR